MEESGRRVACVAGGQVSKEIGKEEEIKED